MGVSALPGGGALVAGIFQSTASFAPGELNQTQLNSAGLTDIFLLRLYPYDP